MSSISPFSDKYVKLSNTTFRVSSCQIQPLGCQVVNSNLLGVKLSIISFGGDVKLSQFTSGVEV